jgi:hypothetical protein
MDFELTEEQRAFQTLAQDFARERMMPFARAWDEDEIFPVQALRQAAALGFGGICVKDDVGGSALSRLDAAIIFRGTRPGLYVDRRLSLDSQYLRVDDRYLRVDGAPAAIAAEAFAVCSILRATA